MLQGNNADGTRNPGYPVLLDVTNYIDYLIVNLWGGNWDWPWKNWWAGRDRSPESTGFKFYTWDYENTTGNNLDRSPLNKNAAKQLLLRRRAPSVPCGAIPSIGCSLPTVCIAFSSTAAC